MAAPTSARTPTRTAVALVAMLAGVLNGCDHDDAARGPVSAEVQRKLDTAADAFFDVPTGYRDGVNALLVSVDGAPVLDRYQHAEPQEQQELASVTTSVVSILVGIALARGDIDDLEQPLAELLPDEADGMSPQVRAVTLRRLITQTAGFRDDAAAWSSSMRGDRDDWVTSALRAHTNDTHRFQESDAGAHLLAVVVEETTGRPLLAYAREVLFEPLGITEATWARDPQGHALGFAGLRLAPADLAKIGQLMLDEGRWHGVQVVPLEWTRESTRTQVAFQQLVEPSGEYGLGWWILDAGPHAAYAATDSTGQLLEVVPDAGVVVVLSTHIGDVSLVGVWGPLSWVANLLVPALE